MIAAVGNGANFDHARDLAAWIGLIPRQSTTGGKPKLLGISKRGNTYLRTLLIHGARATMHILSKSQTVLGEWLRKLLARALQRGGRCIGQQACQACLGHDAARHRLRSRATDSGVGLRRPLRRNDMKKSAGG
ncbi:MAG: IS110 family transposase [Sphingomonadales bacterium]|nr:IS110 family transposase [Sphingomonadales bacterium]